MSTPPDPNNASGDPRYPQYPQPQNPPQQPGYGYPQSPGYNAPPPGYGIPPEGGPTPGYGAPGTATPGYGAAPGYGGPSSPGIPAYGQPAGYGAPQADGPGYGGPPPGYGQPALGYGFPPPGYGRPPYAHWLQRVGAALIDGLIVGVPAGILYGIGFGVGYSSPTCTSDANGYPVCTGGGLSAVGLIVIIVAWLAAIGGGLYLTYLVGTTGQTPGKRVLGIRLIREADGQFLGFGMAFVRNLCHILDSFCYIGYLWPLWDEKRQTFADKIIGTIVVTV